MLWFKKEKPSSEKQSGGVQIQTIPEIFYGGNDPQIYIKAQENGANGAGAKKNTFSLNNGDYQSGAAAGRKKKIILIICGAIFFTGFVGAASWYYLRDYYKSRNLTELEQAENFLPLSESPANKEEPADNSLAATSTAAELTAAASTSTEEVKAASSVFFDTVSDFPMENAIDASDFDADTLTDSEEEIFGTEMSSWDSDNDGYYDGQEVYNLYNPGGFAPVKLIDSGLVKEYINSIWDYRAYYPSKWQAGSVDAEGRQVLFSDVNGDYVEIRVVGKKQDEDFISWFGNRVKGQSVNNLLSMQNRFEAEVWKRSDDLVAYIPDKNWTAVIIYHPISNSPIKSRHIMQMIVQSFRAGSVNTEIKAQEVLYGAQSGSSTLDGAAESSAGVILENTLPAATNSAGF